jgi:hypothetical protein
MSSNFESKNHIKKLNIGIIPYVPNSAVGTGQSSHISCLPWRDGDFDREKGRIMFLFPSLRKLIMVSFKRNISNRYTLLDNRHLPLPPPLHSEECFQTFRWARFI